MARTDPKNSTDRDRSGGVEGYDYCAQTAPSSIADQLRRDGYLRTDMAQGSNGPVTVPARMPQPGDAGTDTDGDADDYNPAAAGQQSAAITTSSGPF